MNELKENIAKHVEILRERYPSLESIKKKIVEAYFLLEEAYKNGGKLLVAGNGGSAADAEHIVGELMKGFKLPRKYSWPVQVLCYFISSVQKGCVFSRYSTGR